MKKNDRESNTRVWEGLPKLVIRWLMVAFPPTASSTPCSFHPAGGPLPMFVGLILLFGF